MKKRSNDIRDALAITAREYNIPAITEPTDYCDYYTETGKRQRPDIKFYTSPCLAIDVTVRNTSEQVDHASEKAAEEKIKLHRDPVQRLGHVFKPFCMETHGHMHKSCSDVIDFLARTVIPSQAWGFKLAMTQAAAMTLAKGRVLALQNAHARQLRR
jgi:hypothetical protein